MANNNNKSAEEKALESNRQFANKQSPFASRTYDRNIHNNNNNSKNLSNTFTNVNLNNYRRDEDDESLSSSSDSSTTSASSTSIHHNHDDGAKKNLFNGQSTTSTATTTTNFLKSQHQHHHHHKKRSNNRVTFTSVLWKKFKKVGIKVMQVSAFLLVINFLIYYWPIESPEIEPKISAYKPRPKFVGPLAVNDKLDSSDTLFSGQFHAPESMAWKKDKRSFYTGVEGGFILFVEPYKERWQIVAKLNAKNSIFDQSNNVQLVLPYKTVQLSSNKKLTNSSSSNHEVNSQEVAASSNATRLVEKVKKATNFVDFCKRDIELYGKRAEFEPQLVSLSRCSRPLGLRLSPDETYLYVNDAISGLYRVDLIDSSLDDVAAAATTTNKKKVTGYKLNQVTKLIDYTSSLEKKFTGSELDDQRVLFSDDIAVDFGAGKNGGDVVYMTDCSKRWNVRFLLRLIIENDDTGRVLSFDVNEKVLKPLESIVPTLVKPEDQYYENNTKKLKFNEFDHDDVDSIDKELIKTIKSVNINGIGEGILDWRNLSFPNGVELTSNKSALLISDLNNRRIIMHHLKGLLKGQSVHLLWVPGYSDNIRRGLDNELNGEPTYWAACGCAVEDGYLELSEFFNQLPTIRKLLLKFIHIIGSIVEFLGNLFNSTNLLDSGFMIKSIWLKMDPYCTHGVVIQFNEQGKILRSLHAPHSRSKYKLLSEAHQVPLFFDEEIVENAIEDNEDQPTTTTTTTNNSAAASALYLGSVYYSYLGRVIL